MLQELASRSAVLGREYVSRWERVANGACAFCEEYGARAERDGDGDSLCRDCIAGEYDMTNLADISEALGCLLFGGRELSSARMRPLADAYKRATDEALAVLFAPSVTIDDVITVKCSHVMEAGRNGFAVPVFTADLLAPALRACESVGWVFCDPVGVWRDSEYAEPVVTDLGHGEFILGEGWCWSEA